MEVARARALDFLEAVDTAGRPYVRNRRTFAMAARQVSASNALAFRDGAGQLVAVVGLHAQTPKRWEAWMAAGPALKANIGDLLFNLRHDLQVAGRVMPGCEIVAYIDPASVAGSRLATILGFQPCEPTPSPIGPLTTYRRSFP